MRAKRNWLDERVARICRDLEKESPDHWPELIQSELVESFRNGAQAERRKSRGE